jgi:hypothetical protein
VGYFVPRRFLDTVSHNFHRLLTTRTPQHEGSGGYFGIINGNHLGALRASCLHVSPLYHLLQVSID